VVLFLLLAAAMFPSGFAHATQGFHSYYGDGTGRTEILTGTGILFRVLVLILLLTTLFRAVKAILREKNADTWDSLLLTPMSRKQIVYQKWWGVLLSERPAFYVLAAILLAQTATGLVSYTGTVSILVGLPAMMAFWGAVGIYLSTRMRTVFQATSTAVVCVVAYAIAAGILMANVNSAARGADTQQFVGVTFNTLVPAFTGFMLMEAPDVYIADVKFGGMIGTLIGTVLHLIGAFFFMQQAVGRVIAEKYGQAKR
jgi:ABC-type Na+ efflux pump permease subunit